MAVHESGHFMPKGELRLGSYFLHVFSLIGFEVFRKAADSEVKM